jgi:hypothetical protein
MDNSPIENFFRILKNKILHSYENEFKTLTDLKNIIKEYIKWYYKERVNAKRKGLLFVIFNGQQSFLQL